MHPPKPRPSDSLDPWSGQESRAERDASVVSCADPQRTPSLTPFLGVASPWRGVVLRCHSVRSAAGLPRSRGGWTRWGPSLAVSARPDGRACSGPRTISKASTVVMRCASSLHAARARQGRGLLARKIRRRVRTEAHGCQWHQGRASADYDIPQQVVGAHH